MAYTKPDFQRAVVEAEKLIDELGYDDPPVSPLEVAEYIGLSVVQEKFLTAQYPPGSDNEEEIAARINRKTNTIHVNPAQPPKSQIFAIAHQIGYFLLNRHEIVTDYTPVKPVLRGKSFFNPDDPDMQEAFHFAANLMVPYDMLKKFTGQSATVLSTIFTVPVPVINYQLRELKR